MDERAERWGGGGLEKNGCKEGKREREDEEGESERAMEGGELREVRMGSEKEREERVEQRLV